MFGSKTFIACLDLGANTYERTSKWLVQKKKTHVEMKAYSCSFCSDLSWDAVSQ